MPGWIAVTVTKFFMLFLGSPSEYRGNVFQIRNQSPFMIILRTVWSSIISADGTVSLNNLWINRQLFCKKNLQSVYFGCVGFVLRVVYMLLSTRFCWLLVNRRLEQQRRPDVGWRLVNRKPGCFLH